MDQSTGSEAAEAGGFYDALRSSGLSAAALAHGDGSIGQECLLTVDEIATLARRVGITAGTPVLDIGSGTGAPACYLARELGCRVLGVDVSAVGHAQAEARARDDGLDHLAHFRLGDIHTIELPPEAFDVIIGLDSWCHIPRRPVLLRRCTQLLRPGGRVAFYDHVLRQPLAEDQRQRFCAVWRFADLESPASYLQALEAAGLEPQWHEETSTYITRFYTRVLEGYLGERARFEAARGPERYLQGLERLEMSERLAATGVLGEFGCIAVKPAS
jgi:cyclopropane fatty-acyl-phospholipid synthase-like methyltransferase